MSAKSEHDGNRNGVHGDDLDLTAYALGQLDASERAEIERQLVALDGDGIRLVEETRRLANKVREVLAADHPAVSGSLRETLIHRLGEAASDEKPMPAVKSQSFWRRHAAAFVAASLVLLLAAAVFWPPIKSAREVAKRATSTTIHDQDADTSRGEGPYLRYQETSGYSRAGEQKWFAGGVHYDTPLAEGMQNSPGTDASSEPWNELAEVRSQTEAAPPAATASAPAHSYFAGANSTAGGIPGVRGDAFYGSTADPSAGESSNHSGVSLMGKSRPQASDSGGYAIAPGGGTTDWDRAGGGKFGGQSDASAPMKGRGRPGTGQPADGWNYRFAEGQGQGQRASEGLLAGASTGGVPGASAQAPMFQRFGGAGMGSGGVSGPGGMMSGMPATTFNITGEQYTPVVENAFIVAQGIDALSTFSIDVDTASYANVRRFLNQSQLPPPDAVRIEELVNYFSYDYPQPKAGEPFSVNMEMAECPWQQQHLLLRAGLKGREIHNKERPVSNLVFLLDVSGSMADENKLPLLKQVLSMMVRELREDDRVSIVTYAGEAGLRLPPTTGNEQEKILSAIDSLSSGGSTNGSAGIELAYDQAQAYFRKEGTNRVILATDGDLNVGITDDESLVKLIKEKAADGTFLTVLGFGEGNLKDAKMERLADNGNGVYAYIDSVREGRKVLIEQMSGSLVTIAKDVKIQIEFNPAQIQSYRLLGYENRMLTAPEFNDDKRDAGEIGAGHTVTALYELVPTGLPQNAGNPPGATDPLKYQSNRISGIAGDVPKAGSLELSEAAKSGELLTLKLRYKEPDGQASKPSEYPLKNRGGKFNAASKEFQFAAAVASFGMHLRNSQYRGEGTLAATAEIAAGAIGEDKGGYRAEFVDLVRKAQALGVK